MSDFKPYTKPTMYVVELCEEEARLIQRLREVKFGSIKVHVTNGKLVRTETSSSQLFSDNSGEKITIAIKTVLE